MRPYTTYKAFGGVLCAFTLPGALLVILGDTPPGGGPALPLGAAVLPGVLGAIGLYVFVASDRELKRLAAADPEPAPKGAMDVKGMLVAAALLGLYLVLVGSRVLP